MKSKFHCLLIVLIVDIICGSIQVHGSLKHSEEQKKCVNLNHVWYNNHCHKLKSSSPCGPGKWLVLKKPKDHDDSNKYQPECQQKKCSEKDEVWWVSENKCITKSEAAMKYCKGKDALVDHDSYGNGHCTCYPDSGLFEDSNDCFEFYQQGPCQITEVVTYNVTSGHAICSKDLCFELNHPNRGKNGKTSAKKHYAPRGGVGQCYKFGPQDICDKLGENAQFKFNTILKVPDCVHASNALIVVPDCEQDENGDCIEVDNSQNSEPDDGDTREEEEPLTPPPKRPPARPPKRPPPRTPKRLPPPRRPPPRRPGTIIRIPPRQPPRRPPAVVIRIPPRPAPRRPRS